MLTLAPSFSLTGMPVLVGSPLGPGLAASLAAGHPAQALGGISFRRSRATQSWPLVTPARGGLRGRLTVSVVTIGPVVSGPDLRRRIGLGVGFAASATDILCSTLRPIVVVRAD